MPLVTTKEMFERSMKEHFSIGAKLETDADIGILDEDVDKVKDVAIFCSPYVTGQ